MRRSLLTFAVVLSATLGVAGQASAADVSVVGPRGGATQTVPFDSLAGSFDIVESDYELRGGAGGPVTRRVTGISIAKLLEAVNADTVYSGLEVVRPDGTAVTLSKYQILAPGATPAIYESGGQLWFIRPSYSAEDANAADHFSLGALTLRQVDLGALKINLTADKRKLRVRQLVRFTASATGAGAGQGYSYSWNFGDGKTATGHTVSHRFNKRGTYRVLVTVKAEGSDRSDPAVISVQVGEPVKSDKKRSGGGTNDAVGAPSSGAADGDQGSGDQAATEGSSAKREPSPRRKKQPAENAGSELPRVTGELLSAETTPLPAQSTLAARGGQQVAPAAEGLGLSREAAFGILAALLMAGGAMLEFGTFGKARRKLRGE